MKKEQLKKEQMAKEQLKKEQMEKEQLKQEEMDKERLKKQQMEKERLAKEELEKERLKQEELEKQRLKKQQMEAEQLKKEQLAEHKERELEEKKKAISSDKKQATIIIVCNVNQNEKFIEVKMQQAVRNLFGKKSHETVDLESDEKHHELTQKLNELVNLGIEDALKPEYHGALQVIFGKAAVEKVVQAQKGN